jgi:hypothetical protein
MKEGRPEGPNEYSTKVSFAAGMSAAEARPELPIPYVFIGRTAMPAAYAANRQPARHEHTVQSESKEVSITEHAENPAARETPKERAKPAITPYRYTAEREVADDLRQELSVISPQEHEFFQERSREARDFYLEKYGTHIQEAARTRLQDVADRVVVTSNESINAFGESWLGDNTDMSSLAGLQTPIGALIVLNNDPNPIQLWAYTEDTIKTQFNSQTFDEKIAIERCHQAYVTSSLHHEIAHELQGNDVANIFHEVGAVYYQNEASTGLNLPSYCTAESKALITIYDKAIEKYGNKVHDVFFGNKTMFWWQKKRIISDVVKMARADSFTAEVIAGYDSQYETHDM